MNQDILIVNNADLILYDTTPNCFTAIFEVLDPKADIIKKTKTSCNAIINEVECVILSAEYVLRNTKGWTRLLVAVKENKFC